MTMIYSENLGSCIEPGGYELDDTLHISKCDKCGADVLEEQWEQCEGGCINQYYKSSCDVCGYEDTNDIF